MGSVMEIVLAEPVYTWGQRPCEGLLPSTRFSDSAGVVAARRRAQRGLGAACKRSNVADRTPRSYGGQQFRWQEQRKLNDGRERPPSPAAASETAFKMALCLRGSRHFRETHPAHHELVGVTDDLFTAVKITT